MVFCAHQGSPWTDSLKKVDPGGVNHEDIPHCPW